MKYIHHIQTYIHNWSLQTTLQSGLLIQFLLPLMLCVLVLYISGGTYNLKSNPNDGFFEQLFQDNFILITEFFSRNLLRGNTFHILF